MLQGVMDVSAPQAATQQPGPPPHWILGFNLLIDRGATMRLMAAVGAALDHGAQRITLCMSSAGGVPEQAFYAYELLRIIPFLTTYNLGTVQSAAVTLFLAGTERLAVPGSTFLMHRTVFNAGPGGSFGRDHLEGQVESVQADDDRAMATVVDRTEKPLLEVEKWFARQQLRDAEFAQRAGIITAAPAPLVLPAGSRFIQVVL
jgi:ATP-dependent protease ClpP protease subunit